MPNPKHHRLGDLQLRIMEVLWDRGEATVGDVFDEISRTREIAYTTAATMLRKMEARGLVKHRAEGRVFVYRAAVKADSVSRNMSDHLLERFFEGNVAEFVSHLLETREVSRDELAKIEKLIAERKKQS